MLNFNQLRIFFHVAKNLSFTAAAKELFITQPAVTAQMKSFEEYCGLKLFKKRGRDIYLTDEGKTLRQYALKIFDYEKEIDGTIEDLRKLKRGTLRLGTTKAYARYFMPFIMTLFHNAFPDIKIQLNEGSSQEMTDSLLQFKNDIVVIAKSKDHPDICFTPFSQEEVVLILTPQHRFARRKSIAFAELAGEPIIMKEIGSGTRKLINGLFEKHGMTPNILMEISNTEFIKQLVQRGDGVSFLIKDSVQNQLQEKSLTTVPFADEKVFLDVSIAYIKNQPLSPPSQALLDILGKLAPNGPIMGIGSLLSKEIKPSKDEKPSSHSRKRKAAPASRNSRSSTS